MSNSDIELIERSYTGAKVWLRMVKIDKVLATGEIHTIESLLTAIGRHTYTGNQKLMLQLDLDRMVERGVVIVQNPGHCKCIFYPRRAYQIKHDIPKSLSRRADSIADSPMRATRKQMNTMLNQVYGSRLLVDKCETIEE